MCSRIHWIFHR